MCLNCNPLFVILNMHTFLDVLSPHETRHSNYFDRAYMPTYMRVKVNYLYKQILWDVPVLGACGCIIVGKYIHRDI